MLRHYTGQDANSLVGGDDVDTSQPNLKKVFLFSLPFGGLPGFQLRFPFTGTKPDPAVEQLRLRLERKDTLNTVDEAKLFHTRGTEDTHLRAMRHLIKENLTDILPDFIKKEKSYEAVFNELDGPIVIMGGYRGSILRDARTRKRVWIPLKAGLNLRKINLLLGPGRMDELRAQDTIIPDGVLKNIGPFDICKKLIKKLDHNPNVTVKEFGYDWRLSLDISAERLIECLEEMQRKTGKQPIVIAHSMGGLVAHGALQQRPELFRGIVYVGAPSECLNILGPLRYGDSVMFSDRILTFETNFMMRSSYAFLPLGGRVFVNQDTGEAYDLDYFDPDTWVEYNLNPLVAKVRKVAEEEEKQAEETAEAERRAEAATEAAKEAAKEAEKNEKRQAERHPEDLLSALSYSPSLSLSLSPSLLSIGSRIKILQPSILRSKPTRLTNLQMQKRYLAGRSSPQPSITSTDGLGDFNFHLSFSEAYNYLADTLRRTKEYMLGLEYDPELDHRYPPMAVVYGNTVPLVRGSKVGSEQDIKDGNYYGFFYGPGDGVVHERWLMPEGKGFRPYNPDTGTGHIVGKFATEGGHVNLMCDFKVMAEALNAIVEADKHWKRAF